MSPKFPTAQALQILDSFASREAEILSLIKSLVEIESPSGDVIGSRQVVDLLAAAAAEIKCITAIDRIDAPLGQHLVIRAFAAPAHGAQAMLVGHTDTVHSRGSLSLNPFRIESGRIFGPGIFDMKANCVLALEALRTLDHLQIKPAAGVAIILTCDEEVGSFSGWPLLESLARELKPHCALVLEPSAGGRVKTGRKGTAMFTLTVEGKAAHAGLDPGKGASAILELAKQIERFHALNENHGGISVNVGVIRGGTRSNVVAAEASAEIDVRFSNASEAEQVLKAFQAPTNFDPRVRISVTGGINRPPLERTEQVLALFHRARDLAAALSFELGETQVGGASDGNFLAALGIPVLDGLGIDGDGAHATHEHILAAAIPRRGALLTGLIASL
jgi:glutamate carboxypeptidase